MKNLIVSAIAVVAAVVALSPGAWAGDSKPVKFNMVVSAGAANCLPDASATVRIKSIGQVEIMDVTVRNLPHNTDFDFFVIQIPVGPFGVAWYQGDIETDDEGEGHARFAGRFSNETFAVAQPPGGAPAPVLHHTPESLVTDASTNPAFEPVHMFHLGLWFDSSQDAIAAGCPGTETRFNGDHTAGLQVLNTSNFPTLEGPLRQITSVIKNHNKE